MKYALILSILLYVFGCFYLVFGIYALFANVKNRVNRLFYYLTSCLAIFAISYSISNSAATEEASTFWRAFAVFGWGVYYSILIHIILIITDNKKFLKNRLAMILIYVPSLVNIILFSPLSPLKEASYNMSQTRYGWINYMPSDILSIGIAFYFIFYSILATVLIAGWWKNNKSEVLMKRQLIYFLISVSVPLITGITSVVLPNVLAKHLLHKLLIVSMIVPIIVLFFSLKKYGLFSERGKTLYVFQQGQLDSEGARIRLFETTALVFIIGGELSFLIGYFGMGKNLESELFLSTLVFIMGLISRFIPLMSKRHIVQNGLYALVCIAGMLFYTLTTADVGGLTTWTVYIIFLLYSVILDTKSHAIAFTVFVIMLQFLFWIISPEITVTVNGGEYSRRIVIILISAFSVRYLSSEYIEKEKQYKRFAKEQQVLEKISTGFLSLNKENAEEKIYEMFKMSYELLNFNHAYLVNFDSDYENATIINTFVNVVEGKKSFPFNPGMKIAVSDFPLAKALIEQKQPVMCDDINTIRPDKYDELREYFKSRDINSYFALPIFVEKDLRGMLVIEYYEKSDVHLRENRLYFLMIIANILGDTRQMNLYEEKLYDYAYFDETTKLANRNMLRKNLVQLLQNVGQTDRIAVFNIEMDNLRMINDTFGHNVGVQIVLKCVEILKSLMKECCIISRVAEGKFVLVMPTTESNEQLKERARKIIDAFTHPILLPDLDLEALFVMVSVGISLYPEDGGNADTLIKNADLAGYEAKSADERIIFCSEQLKDRVEENTLMTHKLFRSLENQEFSLEFQPQISCSTNKTVGIEALLRWTTSDKKRIPPDKFIPILEQTGLIHDVGLWVLDQALMEHNHLIANGFPPIRVSVNLSTVQFRRDDFVQNVADIIQKHGVDPKYVELEITESMLAKNFADTIDKLHQLKALGVKIAVDDFGKGYSSLHRLLLVPLDRIKIDKSIIDDVTFEAKKADIVKIIINLAKNLMLHITAEGVETVDQADFMKDISCDEIQGYYYSRPLKTDALEEFLKISGVEVLN
ncbi:MAG TPA: EAL domain-containing protein [Clostridia bacterium]|jgi:diguanylate cyclase (GGDEF)-like protein|nr:EAL domain-containing protein [Clostridia bacterium]HOM33667.1 EAL domain-containing protein [Clostridia bacterium]HOR88915.1 EAL domain-containing protein [Clostridia bacterium]HOT71337.1 EAL domain-containing protein [Clostridia bacterium]HPL07241.1 EAL domain-containing protein [Clostridia bacterium]